MSKKIPTSFIVTRKFVRSLGLKSTKEWNKYSKSAKRPKHIPSNPVLRYANEWTSWGDFLGTGRIATRNMQYRSFKEARKFVRSLKLTSNEKWKAYCKSGKKPDDIPKTPRRVYKKQWISVGDWLGTGRIADQFKTWRRFEDARKFARKLGLKNNTEWRKWKNSGKKPEDIPANPDGTYKNKGWISWGNFLGTGNIGKGTFKQFTDARKFVRKLGLKNAEGWRKYCGNGKKPEDIPGHPHTIYKNKGWTSWGDFLGTNIISNKMRGEKYLPMHEALPIFRKLAKQYGLIGITDWMRFEKTHKKLLNDLQIPAAPWVAYSKENVIKRRKK